MKKKTHDEFIADLQRVNPYVKVLSRYEKSNLKVQLQCRKCGSLFSMRPNNLLSGQGCPECGKKRGIKKNTKTHAQFVAELCEVNPTIEVVGKYVHNQKPIKVRCGLCAHEWEPRAGTLLQGHGCPKCSKVYRRTHEEFVRDLEERNPNIEVLGHFSSMREIVHLKCKLCNEEWDAMPCDLFSGKGCPHCYHTSTSFMEQFILLSLRSVLGDKAVVSRDRKTIGIELDIYVPSKRFAIEPGSWDWHKSRLDRDCEKRRLCSDVGIRLVTIYDRFPQTAEKPFDTDCLVFPDDLGLKAGREKLIELVAGLLHEMGVDSDYGEMQWSEISKEAYGRSHRKTTEEFARELEEANPSIELRGDYTGSKNRIRVRCKNCEYEWDGNPSDLLRGIGCPRCAGVLKKTQGQFLADLAKVNADIRVIGDYKNSKTRLEVQCRICNHIWSPTPNELLSGNGCPVCHPQSKLKTLDEFTAGVAKNNPNIKVIGPYKGMKKPIRVKCRICEMEWSPIASTIYHGQARRHLH